MTVVTKRIVSVSLAALCVVGFASAVYSQTATSDGQHADVVIGEPAIGWRGNYKLGTWTPVTVPIELPAAANRAPSGGNEVHVELGAVDGDDLTGWLQFPKVELTEGATTWRGWIRFGRKQSGLKMRLTSGASVLAEHSWSGNQMPPNLEPHDQLVVSIGSWPTLVTAADRRSGRGRRLAVAEVTPDALPLDRMSYEAVDLVVMPLASVWGSAKDSAERGGAAETGGRLSDAQWRALRDWVLVGGRLLVFGAEGLDQPLPTDHPLSDLLPGPIVRVTAQRQTAGLEGFVGGGAPLSAHIAPGALNFSVPVAVVDPIDGRAIVTEGFGESRQVLVIHRAVGLGHVVFAGLDLDQFPFTDWPNTTRLVDRLFDQSLGQLSQQRDEAGMRIAHAGYEDLAGQLRVALDQFEGVAVTPFSWVAMLIGIYIALIGPLDYWLLRRLDRRFVWTWATFPLVVGLVSCLGLALSSQWKGNSRHLNQLDVIDWDATTGVARGTHWMQVYSPKAGRESWRAEVLEPWSSGAPRERWLSWLGLPGTSFGGMHNPPSRWGHDLSYRAPIELAASGAWQGSMVDVPMDAASSRGLSGRWWSLTPAGDVGNLSAGPSGELSGEVRNVFPTTLRRLWLVHERWVYELQQLPAGGTWTIDSSTLPKNIEYLLTQRRVIDGKDRGTAWNPQSTDIERIMQVMALHAAAGGADYTGLAHRYHAELDLSRLVRLNRAILIGWGDESRLQLHDVQGPIEPDRRWSMYRVIIPVTRGN